MDKVLVVKAVKPNYNTLSGGPPIMMVGGGGGRGGGGTTMRQRAGSLAGGLVGVAGALAGQHRSLGSLAQSMISGGAQGAALGGALGRRLVGRKGQARADLREASRQQRAEDRARDAEELRNRGQGIGSMASLANKMPRLAAVLNPAASIRRHNYEVGRQEDEKADIVRVRNQAADYARGASGDEYRRQGNEMRRRNQAREEAIAREAGAGYGRDMKAGYERYDKLREQGIAGTGKTREEFDSAIDEINARKPMQGGNVRVDPSPAQGSGMTAVLDAGNNLLAGPEMNSMSVRQLPPPAGSVGSGNETADRQGQGINDAQGFNFETENEPGDNMKPKTLAGAMKEDEEEDPSRQVGVVGNQQPPQVNRQQEPSTLRGAYDMDERM